MSASHSTNDGHPRRRFALHALSLAMVAVLVIALVAAYRMMYGDAAEASSDGQDGTAEAGASAEFLDDVITYYDDFDGYWETVEAVQDGLISESDLTHPWVLDRDHVDTDVSYPVTPPAGGPHNSIWQECTGTVYSDPVLDVHAVHSLEHGAVWLTYDPSAIDAPDIMALAETISEFTYTFMSPYPGQEATVSLQAWGAQLPLEDVDITVVTAFITHYRLNEHTSPEPFGPCSAGTTETSATTDEPADS
ncbi:DUF3105 domain-containing protein [Natronoglycomyces albus]|uniref:DUF3105 domain-containing protein n=1 Tax=Natronoglycomyces albus TaxID=2811108 RepID=A0A895XJQ9_9ACTN|nr:DUF3105 domain-containing protein [Natronoglycomyces albus]QSB05247.1 DUF3105 domain-containing protein [Natronoglycomyces albus]